MDDSYTEAVASELGKAFSSPRSDPTELKPLSLSFIIERLLSTLGAADQITQSIENTLHALAGPGPAPSPSGTEEPYGQLQWLNQIADRLDEQHLRQADLLRHIGVRL